MHITLNKNSVPGDKSAITPGGIRIGTPALTTRGFKEADFEAVAEFIHRAVLIAQDLKATTPAPAKMVQFKEHLVASTQSRDDLKALAQEVADFAAGFPMPGL